MEELNERLAIREERIATRNAAMNGDIRPLINQFRRRDAQARTFLTPLALNTIQSYLPGQNLQYFREPKNRLQIFRRGLVDVLQKLNITTFTREEVFAALRANQIACLNYMMRVHPTMIQDHAKKYTANDIIRQLRTNEPVGVLEHMHRLDPSMFEDTNNLRPHFYSYLHFGYPPQNPPYNPGQRKNFIERFEMVARLLNITEFTRDELYTAMQFNHPELIDCMFRLHPTIGRDIGKVAIISFFNRHHCHANVVVSILQHVLLAGNPLHRVDLTPDDLTQLGAFQRLLNNHANNRRIVDLINGHVVTDDEMFPRLVHQYLNDFELDWRRGDYLAGFIGEVVFLGNLERFHQIINVLPATQAVVDMIFSIDLDPPYNPEVVQRLRDHVALVRGPPPSAASDAGFFLFNYS
jgi:hypothetical protein